MKKVITLMAAIAIVIGANATAMAKKLTVACDTNFPV